MELPTVITIFLFLFPLNGTGAVMTALQSGDDISLKHPGTVSELFSELV